MFKGRIVIWSVLLLMLILCVGLALLVGSERLSIFDLSGAQAAIFYEIRLPRVLLAAWAVFSLRVVSAVNGSVSSSRASPRWTDRIPTR